MNTFFNRKSLLSMLGKGALIAGMAGGVGISAAHAEDITAADVANAQVRVIEGQFEDADNSAECLALRAKIFKDRETLKLTSEWRAVADTPEYKTLEADKAHFDGAGCNKPSSTPPAACAELGAKVKADGAALASTQQWGALNTVDHFHDLMNNWGKATQLNCVK
jgi:hypothetical protein